MRFAMALLALVSACAPDRYIVLQGHDIHTHLGELRRNGSAAVEPRVMTDGELSRRHEPKETVRLDTTVTLDDTSKTIAQLAQNCPDEPLPPGAAIPDDNQCELYVRDKDPFALRMYAGGFSARRAADIAVKATFTGLFAGGVLCGIMCRSPEKYVAAGTSVLILVGAIVICLASHECRD